MQTQPFIAATSAVSGRSLAAVPTDDSHPHPPHLQRGLAAEQLAADYLQAHGLVLLERNLRCKVGEIDLVCTEGAVLAIIEVRQRVRGDFGGALGSVTWRKQRKIIRAARYFFQRRPQWRTHRMRFDVVALEGLPDGAHRFVWIKDAFRSN
jgi:putative endonuclease